MAISRCCTAVLMGIPPPPTHTQSYRTSARITNDNATRTKINSGDIDSEGYLYQYEVDITGGLEQYDKLSTKDLQIWGGSLTANKIKLKDFELLRIVQSGSLTADVIDFDLRSGSGVDVIDFDNQPDITTSKIRFESGSLVADEVNVHVEPEEVWNSHLPFYRDAWGPEIENPFTFSRRHGEGNVKFNIDGIISRLGAAKGTVFFLHLPDSGTGTFDVDVDFDIKTVKGYSSAIGMDFTDRTYEWGNLIVELNGTVDISDVKAHDYASGITLETQADVVFNQNVSIRDVDATDEDSKVFGVNNGGDKVWFNGGLQIDCGTEGTENTETNSNKIKRVYAIYNKKDTKKLTISGGDVINTIKGQIVNESVLEAHFDNADSYFEGAVVPTSENVDTSKIHTSLSFANGGYWNMTKDSGIQSLNLSNAGIVNLTAMSNKDNRNVRLETDKLTSNNGLAQLHLDLKNQQSGSLITTGDASGTLDVYLDLENYSQGFAKSEVPLIKITNNDASTGDFQIGKLTYKDGAVQNLEMHFFEEGQTGPLGELVSNANGGWYLVKPSGNDSQTPEMGQMLGLGASVSQGIGMLSETEDLRMRMGDVRFGARDGVWARSYARQDRADGTRSVGFKQEVNGMHFGLDHLVPISQTASWLLGGSVHYGKSSMEGVADSNGGNAKVDQYTMKAYATYLNENGIFADYVLHVGYYDTKIQGMSNTGKHSLNADYSNMGYGISAEIGRRLNVGEKHDLYVEPVAQLTWFRVDGKNFNTSTGLNIDQSNADFITGRLGATVGKVFALGTTDNPQSSYLSVSMKGGMLYQFDGDQTITARGTDGGVIMYDDAMDMKGARAYYGVSADWKIDDTWRFYGQISREEGNGYTKDYDASVGIRYAF